MMIQHTVPDRGLRSGSGSGSRSPSRSGSKSAPDAVLIDNYDSFTYNLVQRLGELGARVEVVRNDALSAEELVALRPARLILSPGPCTPDEAGISVEVIRLLCGLNGASRPPRPVPILGVCLGHQSIGQAFGARIIRARAPVHGKAGEIEHDGSLLFRGAPRRFLAGRYHSLIVDEKTLPKDLRVSARTADGIVMALRHRTLPVFGVQFHPESILTPEGPNLLRNFLAVGA